LGRDAIAARKAMIQADGLESAVVESLPVYEEIKVGGSDTPALIDAYRQSLSNLVANGMRVVTYNFMPLLDWTRTELDWRMPDDARALRFEWKASRSMTSISWGGPTPRPTRRPTSATVRRRVLPPCRQTSDICSHARSLPGGRVARKASRRPRSLWRSRATRTSTRIACAHHTAFLEAVCPVADDLGIRLVVHPDDPPFPIFGLPRVVSTEADLTALFTRVPNRSNGLCFCAGSLGVREDNDLPGIIDHLGDRIGFLHLRSAHLEGDADMAALVDAIHDLSVREGRSIPMRPDHGHRILDDMNRAGNPGYPLLGRMRGLAELRGLERGIAHARAAGS
jgi:mannonate dehydratase